MTRQQPPLSEAQLEIMSIVWDLGEAAVSDVWRALSQRRKIARNTVQTTLVRLEEKGYLQHRAVGNSFLYSAAKDRKRTIGRLLRSLVETAFKGSTEGLVMALLEESPPSEEELRESSRCSANFPRRKRDSTMKAFLSFVGQDWTLTLATSVAVQSSMAIAFGWLLSGVVMRRRSARPATRLLARHAVPDLVDSHSDGADSALEAGGGYFFNRRPAAAETRSAADGRDDWRRNCYGRRSRARAPRLPLAMLTHARSRPAAGDVHGPTHQIYLAAPISVGSARRLGVAVGRGGWRGPVYPRSIRGPSVTP